MRRFLVVTAVSVAVLLAGCSSGAEEGSTSSAAASSQSSEAAYPVALDGSIVTASGYVFKGDFAICNQARCEAPGPDGTARCTCDLLSDQWTLSPIPKSSLVELGMANATLSTFTTVNVTQASAVKCEVGQWADCYGALCTPNADGTATCTCPVSDDNSVEWMKYVETCSAESNGCTADLVSVAPLFAGDMSFTDFRLAVEQAGDSIPGIPQTCPANSSAS